MHELDNMTFSTKSIKLTDKQEDMISDLLDQLNDMGIDDYNDIKYWKLSKQDASKLIGELLDKIQYEKDYEYDLGFDPAYDVGDN